MAKYDYTTGAWVGHTEEELDELEKEEMVNVITKPCPVCKKTSVVKADKYGIKRWASGDKIQNAFPEMPSEDRELLISGTHSECWEKLFPPEKEEEKDR